MTAIVSNYVSPEDLTLWLAEKQNDVYADMRGAIDMSNERSQMQSDLGDIKKALTDAHASGNFQQVSKDIAAFLEKYKNNPDSAEVSQPLVEIMQAVDKFYSDAAGAKAIQIYGAEMMGNTAEVQRLQNAPPPQLVYSQVVIDNWSDAIESKTNFLSQQDQLAMIQIQELSGKVNQSEQLVSNLIASQNQTQNAVISNIRG